MGREPAPWRERAAPDTPGGPGHRGPVGAGGHTGERRTARPPLGRARIGAGPPRHPSPLHLPLSRPRSLHVQTFAVDLTVDPVDRGPHRVRGGDRPRPPGTARRRGAHRATVTRGDGQRRPRSCGHRRHPRVHPVDEEPRARSRRVRRRTPPGTCRPGRGPAGRRHPLLAGQRRHLRSLPQALRAAGPGRQRAGVGGQRPCLPDRRLPQQPGPDRGHEEAGQLLRQRVQHHDVPARVEGLLGPAEPQRRRQRRR